MAVEQIYVDNHIRLAGYKEPRQQQDHIANTKESIKWEPVAL